MSPAYRAYGNSTQLAYTDAEVIALGLKADDRTMCRIVGCECGATVETASGKRG